MEIEQENEVAYGNGADWTGEVHTRWKVSAEDTELILIKFYGDKRDGQYHGGVELQDEAALAAVIGEEPAKSMLDFQMRNAQSDYNALEPRDGKDREDKADYTD